MGVAFVRFMERFTAEERGEIETHAQMLIAEAMPLRDLRRRARQDAGSVGAETEDAANGREAAGQRASPGQQIHDARTERQGVV